MWLFSLQFRVYLIGFFPQVFFFCALNAQVKCLKLNGKYIVTSKEKTINKKKEKTEVRMRQQSEINKRKTKLLL